MLHDDARFDALCAASDEDRAAGRFVWVCPTCGFTSPMLLPHCRGPLSAPHPMAFPVQQEVRDAA